MPSRPLAVPSRVADVPAETAAVALKKGVAENPSPKLLDVTPSCHHTDLCKLAGGRMW